MTQDGLQFIPGEVSEWMDCGWLYVTVDTNAHPRIWKKKAVSTPLPASAKVTGSVIAAACHIGEGVVLERTVVETQRDPRRRHHGATPGSATPL